jgi:uncharacterized membrane protein YraQ (UPF0718 family)
VLAVILTARILGAELGIARAVGAISISILIGVIMAFLFRKEEQTKIAAQAAVSEESQRPLMQNVLFFAAMIGILIFANICCQPPEEISGKLGIVMYSHKHAIVALCSIALGVMLVLWFGMKWWKVLLVAVPVAVLTYWFPENIQIPFVAGVLGLSLITSTDKGECGDWFASTWSFAKEMFPLLLFGVFLAGLLLGRVGEEGLIPSEWIAWALGGNTVRANFFASIAGAFMYFATCTEVPFVQALMGAGMGNGPALSLLLAGPSLSLPSMLVIYSILGFKKTAVFVILIIIFSMSFGMLFGWFFASCAPTA